MQNNEATFNFDDFEIFCQNHHPEQLFLHIKIVSNRNHGCIKQN